MQPEMLSFLEATKGALLDEAERDTNKRRQLARIIGLMGDLRINDKIVERREMPVCAHLNTALQLAELGYTKTLASSLHEMAPTLTWAQNPRYTEETRGRHFLQNYAYCELGLVGNELLSFGLLLLGPNTTYPLTNFESEGVFLIIGGNPEWKSGENPWKKVGSGDIISRPWNGAEGKRTGIQPMLAIYAWLYDRSSINDDLEKLNQTS